MHILLHICCGVCAAGAAQALLSEGHIVTGYFYNPNIHPQEEYRLRLETARRVAWLLAFPLEEGPYDTDSWHAAVRGLEHEPEGGRRCAACLRLRLQRACDAMPELHATAFTTTLTISPRKRAPEINLIGRETGGESFLSRDFKKRDGFKHAMQSARSWGLYRQDYCGCLFGREGAAK